MVTKVYQVVQYERKACFHAFVEDGAQARRCGDVDGAGSDTKLLAENTKLKLNVAYDKTRTNQ